MASFPYEEWIGELRKPQADEAAGALRAGKVVVLYGPRGYGKSVVERAFVRAAPSGSLSVRLDVGQLARMSADRREAVLNAELGPGRSPDLRIRIQASDATVFVIDAPGAGSGGAGVKEFLALFELATNDPERRYLLSVPSTASAPVHPYIAPAYLPGKSAGLELRRLRPDDPPPIWGGQPAGGWKEACTFTGGNPRWTYLAAWALREAGRTWSTSFEALLAEGGHPALQPWWDAVERVSRASADFEAGLHRLLDQDGPVTDAGDVLAPYVELGVLAPPVTDLAGRGGGLAVVPAARLRYRG